VEQINGSHGWQSRGSRGAKGKQGHPKPGTGVWEWENREAASVEHGRLRHNRNKLLGYVSFSE
jgi:hypothetical protein